MRQTIIMTAETQKFSDETIASLVELGKVFLRIRNRLISEGYVIKDGKTKLPEHIESQAKNP